MFWKALKVLAVLNVGYFGFLVIDHYTTLVDEVCEWFHSINDEIIATGTCPHENEDHEIGTENSSTTSSGSSTITQSYRVSMLDLTRDIYEHSQAEKRGFDNKFDLYLYVKSWEPHASPGMTGVCDTCFYQYCMHRPDVLMAGYLYNMDCDEDSPLIDGKVGSCSSGPKFL